MVDIPKPCACCACRIVDLTMRAKQHHGPSSVWLCLCVRRQDGSIKKDFNYPLRFDKKLEFIQQAEVKLLVKQGRC